MALKLNSLSAPLMKALNLKPTPPPPAPKPRARAAVSQAKAEQKVEQKPEPKVAEVEFKMKAPPKVEDKPVGEPGSLESKIAGLEKMLKIQAEAATMLKAEVGSTLTKVMELLRHQTQGDLNKRVTVLETRLTDIEEDLGKLLHAITEDEEVRVPLPTDEGEGIEEVAEEKGTGVEGFSVNEEGEVSIDQKKIMSWDEDDMLKVASIMGPQMKLDRYRGRPREIQRRLLDFLETFGVRPSGKDDDTEGE